MTIKQQGGIFGRNPKFNDVEVETLTVAGNAVPDASTILVDGDIGSTVQGYDAATAKTDETNTFSVAQNFSNTVTLNAPTGQDHGDYIVQRESTGSYPVGISMLDTGGTRGARIAAALNSVAYHAGSDGVSAFGGAASHTFYTNLNQVLQINSSGNLVMNSGSGIDFSATGDGPSADGELFSDYEEGTYTPTLQFGTGVSYSNQAGTYTKIGNTVFVEIDITATFSSDSSAVQISLPFAPGGSDRACTVGYNTDQTSMFSYSITATTPLGAELTSSVVRVTGANGNFIIYSESVSGGRLNMAIMYRIA